MNKELPFIVYAIHPLSPLRMINRFATRAEAEMYRQSLDRKDRTTEYKVHHSKSVQGMGISDDAEMAG
jgi:hypothetical protein